MNYEDRVVCFIDILGFKSHVSSTVDQHNKEVVAETERLMSAFNIIKGVDCFSDDGKTTKKVTQFSDCLVVSFEHSEESEVFWTLYEIQLLLIELVNYGILCRGAVTFGKLVHTDDVVFGPALVDAYILESKAANYPRVLIDNSILSVAKKYHGSHHSPEDEVDSIERCTMVDSDGMRHIDYIVDVVGEFDDLEYDYVIFLGKLRELIQKHLDSPKPDIRVKYSWLKEKYNEAVGYQHTVANRFSDPDLAESFLSLSLLS